MPSLTYSVQKGWSNMEDLPGNFLLVPPGASLEGVNPGTSDFIGVYPAVAAPAGCEERPDPSVETNVAAYLDWLQRQESMLVSEPRPIQLGGMSGTEVDVSLSDGPVCSDPNIADEYALVIIGVGRSSLTHGVVPGYPLRLDLFDMADGEMMAIELADAPNGGSDFDDWWAAAADVTNTFRFGS
ncbi:MAG TPA: hypothetical protein VES40_08655 [Ilumatobacteraceae bacterium]|nr:hypothetical protein [Ilumatobacteraceae bacterium]